MSPTEVAQPPRRSQADRRRDSERALLVAAARLFARRGIEGTSLAEIGEEAGFSRGLVNHRFGSKAALVAHLANACQDAILGTIRRPELSGAVDALIGMVRAYLDNVAEMSDTASAFFVMWGAAFPSESPLRETFIVDDGRFRDAIEELVRASRREGVASDVDPAAFAVLLVAMLRGIAAQVIVDPESVDITAVRESAITFIQSALGTIASPGARPGATLRSSAPN